MKRNSTGSGLVMALSFGVLLLSGCGLPEYPYKTVASSGAIPAKTIWHQYEIGVESNGKVIAEAYFYEKKGIHERYLQLRDGAQVTVNGLAMKEISYGWERSEGIPQNIAFYRTELRLPLDELRFEHRDADGKTYVNVVPLGALRLKEALPNQVSRSEGFQVAFTVAPKLTLVSTYGILRPRGVEFADVSTSGVDADTRMLVFSPAHFKDRPLGNATLELHWRTEHPAVASPAGGLVRIDWKKNHRVEVVP